MDEKIYKITRDDWTEYYVIAFSMGDALIGCADHAIKCEQLDCMISQKVLEARKAEEPVGTK